MAYDPSPTTQDALSIIIQNFNNGLDPSLHLDDTNFVFDVPTPNPDVAYSQNTRLFAMPTAVSGRYGRAVIYYDRMNLAAMPTAATVSRGSATKMSGIIAQINSFYGINLVAADYEDDNLPVNGAATLRIKSGSLLFINNLPFTLTA